MTELWVQILALRVPSYVLGVLGKHPELLQNEKLMTELWGKILALRAGPVLEVLGNYPELLQNEKLTTALLNKIFDLSDFYEVLKLLGEHPELLQNEKLTSEHWEKIISFELAKVLKHLIQRPELLQDSVFLNKILQSKNILHALEWARWGKYITISPEGYTLSRRLHPN